MYGKLVNGELIEAPKDLVLENGTVVENFNRSISLMKEYGFRPVIKDEPGHDIETQYCKFVGYEDTGYYIRFKYELEDIEFSEAEIQNKDAQKAMEMLNMDFQAQVQTLSDEQALQVSSVFPLWQTDVDYDVNFKVRHNDILYKVLQSHHSQSDWTPDIAVSLFTRVLVGEVNPETGEIEILEWVQPDSTNPYMIGDKVIYNEIVYESIIDNNIWSPENYPAGWIKVEK